MNGASVSINIPPMIRRQLYFAMLVALLAVLSLASARAQDAQITVSEATPNGDISRQRQLVMSSEDVVNLIGLTEKAPIALRAKGKGPRHYWSLFSFKNNTDKALNYVLSFQPQNFAGVGLLRPELTVQEVQSAASLRDGTPVNIVDAGASQYSYVAVAPHDVTNIAFESNGPALNATLWRASDFGSANVGPLFLTGFMQGMAVLGLVCLLALYTFRPQRVTLAGALFGCSLLLFVESDLGLFALPLAGQVISGSLLRALVETLMAATLALCIISFHGPFAHKRYAYGGAALGILAASLANLAYAAVEPLNASAIARVLFVGGVCAGIVLATSKSKQRLGFDWLFWLAVTLWTGLAAFIAGWGYLVISAHLWMTAATLLLLFAVALVLIRFVYDLRRREMPSMHRAELRSLALAAGQHIMWEWLPERGFLHVGPELPRRLNLDPEAWEQDARAHFHAVLHPFDLASYQSLAERVDFKPGEAISLELRLRGQDGIYHWFELQARTVRAAHHMAQRCIGTLTDIDRLKSAADQLAMDSVQDAITGLPNKALFMDRLERVLAQLGGLPFRVIMLDIDRFKALNEGLGQEAGDTILKTIANRLTGLLEADESAARLNGGQFVVHCAESLARGDFSVFLRKLEEEVSAPIKLGAQEVVISTSTGVSASGASGMAAQDLVDQSLAAMLEARKQGGARTVFYDATMIDDRAKLFSLESDLRRALARHQIEIHYQPIVDLLTLEVRGFEALARWRHPEHGLLVPADFMDIAENGGLMGEITQFMMQGAARQLGIWRRVHVREAPFFVSVNVSASQIVDQQFVARVQQVLGREQPEPGSLKIEITETVIMRQPERSAQVLRQLRAMGVGLACDDFGTGFSSLASLRDLPFDTLKIDRSFIADEIEERNAKIIGSITALAASLNMAVVAEGIETQEQIDALAILGCTLGQGYLLGMPENAEGATLRLMKQGLINAPALQIPAMDEEPVSALASTAAYEDAEPAVLPPISDAPEDEEQIIEAAVPETAAEPEAEVTETPAPRDAVAEAPTEAHTMAAASPAKPVKKSKPAAKRKPSKKVAKPGTASKKTQAS